MMFRSVSTVLAHHHSCPIHVCLPAYLHTLPFLPPATLHRSFCTITYFQIFRIYIYNIYITIVIKSSSMDYACPAAEREKIFVNYQTHLVSQKASSYLWYVLVVLRSFVALNSPKTSTHHCDIFFSPPERPFLISFHPLCISRFSFFVCLLVDGM